MPPRASPIPVPFSTSAVVTTNTEPKSAAGSLYATSTVANTKRPQTKTTMNVKVHSSSTTTTIRSSATVTSPTMKQTRRTRTTFFATTPSTAGLGWMWKNLLLLLTLLSFHPSKNFIVVEAQTRRVKIQPFTIFMHPLDKGLTTAQTITVRNSMETLLQQFLQEDYPWWAGTSVTYVGLARIVENIYLPNTKQVQLSLDGLVYFADGSDNIPDEAGMLRLVAKALTPEAVLNALEDDFPGLTQASLDNSFLQDGFETSAPTAAPSPPTAAGGDDNGDDNGDGGDDRGADNGGGGVDGIIQDPNAVEPEDSDSGKLGILFGAICVGLAFLVLIVVLVQQHLTRNKRTSRSTNSKHAGGDSARDNNSDSTTDSSDQQQLKKVEQNYDSDDDPWADITAAEDINTAIITGAVAGSATKSLTPTKSKKNTQVSPAKTEATALDDSGEYDDNDELLLRGGASDVESQRKQQRKKMRNNARNYGVKTPPRNGTGNVPLSPASTNGNKKSPGRGGTTSGTSYLGNMFSMQAQMMRMIMSDGESDENKDDTDTDASNTRRALPQDVEESSSASPSISDANALRRDKSKGTTSSGGSYSDDLSSDFEESLVNTIQPHLIAVEPVESFEHDRHAHYSLKKDVMHMDPTVSAAVQRPPKRANSHSPNKWTSSTASTYMANADDDYHCALAPTDVSAATLAMKTRSSNGSGGGAAGTSTEAAATARSANLLGPPPPPPPDSSPSISSQQQLLPKGEEESSAPKKQKGSSSSFLVPKVGTWFGVNLLGGGSSNSKKKAEDDVQLIPPSSLPQHRSRSSEGPGAAIPLATTSEGGDSTTFGGEGDWDPDDVSSMGTRDEFLNSGDVFSTTIENKDEQSLLHHSLRNESYKMQRLRTPKEGMIVTQTRPNFSMPTAPGQRPKKSALSINQHLDDHSSANSSGEEYDRSVIIL